MNDSEANDSEANDEALRLRSVKAARDTRVLCIERGVRHAAADHFAALFPQRPARIVADANTFRAAGRDVVDSFRRAGHACLEPFVFDESHLPADYEQVEKLEQVLAGGDALAVAVGSGTINDLTKLASHRLGRPYLSIATAASMDGYTAFGASITRQGSKQTFHCPAPAGLLADLDVLEAAPPEMNAWGYADLLAKSAAGADWLLADALEVEPIDAEAWEIVQSRLRIWLADPAGLRQGEPEAVRRLILGLALSGFAMQASRSSRPASGAEHQFSHLWDMQHHVYRGHHPSHGFKVGIGTLASAVLYGELMKQPLEELDVERCCRAWPDMAAVEAAVESRFSIPELAAKALEEIRAKYSTVAELRSQLVRLRDVWPRLLPRLTAQLMVREEVRQRLAAAGCPCRCEDIGISPSCRESYRQAYYIRRRFTVLDVAVRTGLLDACLDRIFTNP